MATVTKAKLVKLIREELGHLLDTDEYPVSDEERFADNLVSAARDGIKNFLNEYIAELGPGVDRKAVDKALHYAELDTEEPLMNALLPAAAAILRDIHKASPAEDLDWDIPPPRGV